MLDFYYQYARESRKDLHRFATSAQLLNILVLRILIINSSDESLLFVRVLQAAADSVRSRARSSG